MSATVILDMTKVLERAAAVYDLRRPALAFGLSGLAGFLAGLAGGGMMTIAVYLRYACRDHLSLRATAILIGTALVVWRLIDTAAAGLITRQLVAEAVLLLPAVYIGIWIGAHFFRTMSPTRYFTFFRLVLLASALGLVVKGLTRFV